MVRADLPYTYRSAKKLASGKFRDYWRFRRDGRDTPLPGQPGDAAFHARYAELMAECDASADRAKAAEPARTTFAWLARAYLASAEFAALADRTQADYRATIEHQLVPALGPERFDCIMRPHIKLIRDAVARSHSARTAHKIKQVASLLYTWADQQDLLPAGFTNPAMNIKRIKGTSKPIEVWSPEEIALFLFNATGTARTAAILALYTGQRREDLVRMTWADALGDVIRVRQNKTGEPLTIPCHPTLREHLKVSRTQFGGPILRGADGKPLTPGALSQIMHRAIRAVPGMPLRSLHGLRYAAAGALEATGCSVVQISSVIGHRTYQMALKYARQRHDAEAAMAKLENKA